MLSELFFVDVKHAVEVTELILILLMLVGDCMRTLVDVKVLSVSDEIFLDVS